MKYLTTILLLFFGVVVSAQTKLEGKVLDSETGEPLIYATVALYANGVLRTGTETDFDGFYSISNFEEGNYDIEFSYTGYTPLKMKNINLIPGKANKLDAKMSVGFRSCCPICSYTPPLIYQDDTTQGRVFSSADIRRSPFR